MDDILYNKLLTKVNMLSIIIIYQLIEIMWGRVCTCNTQPHGNGNTERFHSNHQ